jgi:hypothetical protein
VGEKNDPWGRFTKSVKRPQGFQHVDRAGRQFAERRVGGREDRERTGALERLDQAGRFDGRDERGVIPGVHRVRDDVLRRKHRFASDHDGPVLGGEAHLLVCK